MRAIPRAVALVCAGVLLSGCSMMRLMQTMLATNKPNERILGEMFAAGGAGRADFGSDGVARISVVHPAQTSILRPAIINMAHPGDLELTVANNEPAFHMMVVMQSDGGMQALNLPAHTAGTAHLHFGTPGLYLIADGFSNHMGRGMMGMIVVSGEVPPEAKLDRPKQPRP